MLVFFLQQIIFDTRSNDGELRLSLMATLAQEESRKISSRVNWATKRNYENGVAHGTMPYGYKRENGKIVIVEDEAKVVQQISFDFILMGMAQDESLTH